MHFTSSDDCSDGTPDCRTGYLYLSKHPGRGVPGSVKRQVWLHEIVPDYKGPAVYLDFNGEDELVGIEVIEELD